MCLTIDLSKHPDLKPIRLDEDLIVTKCLCNKHSANWSFIPLRIRAICNFTTPYRYKPIHFLFGKCILRTKLDKPQKSKHRSYSFEIYKGIHAYNLHWKNFYFAIIPKGTLVYYGYNNEIVAEKLIIYKNKKKWQQLK